VLREGDICSLKWSEIDGGRINKVASKTGKAVRIPVLGGLRCFLDWLERAGEYVLPVHNEMYRVNPYGVSYRFKKFLGEIGIESVAEVEGRIRKLSVKDVHSLRHTFIYMALTNSPPVPLPVVQSIVGHIDDRITRIYMDHANDDDKMAAMAGVDFEL